MATRTSNGTTQKLQYRWNDGELTDIKKSLPKGYEIEEGTFSEPPGTRWARKKGVKYFKRDKSGKLMGQNPKYKRILVITDEDYFTSRIAEDRIYEPDKAKRFITNATIERKIAAKENRGRKQLQDQKESDKRAIAAAIAREQAKRKQARSTNGTKVPSRQVAPKPADRTDKFKGADDIYTTKKSIAVVKVSSDRRGRTTTRVTYYPKTRDNLKAAKAIFGQISPKR